MVFSSIAGQINSLDITQARPPALLMPGFVVPGWPCRVVSLPFQLALLTFNCARSGRAGVALNVQMHWWG